LQFCKAQWPRQRPAEYAGSGKGCYRASVIRHQSLSPQHRCVDNPSSLAPGVTRLRAQPAGLQVRASVKANTLCPGGWVWPAAPRFAGWQSAEFCTNK